MIFNTFLINFVANTSRRSQHAANLNMSALDKLVSQYDDDEYDAEPTVEESVVELSPSTDEPRDLEERRSNAEFYKFINGRMRDEMSQEEWDLVVREYYRQPATDLERFVATSCMIKWLFFLQNLNPIVFTSF
jgi:hypothetical protein